ncbi:CAP domain-containing protein [Massilia phyllosphaerae]|uniref:CAP domain-containing protein n=1 Tax=Massilia phyllosphaerae TaxID=3106034 RepID=UPI002B1CB85A|nr:CAP domain-containing protein [Massilia sp. SGZ-792]
MRALTLPSALVLITLTACGGGSSGGSSTPVAANPITSPVTTTPATPVSTAQAAILQDAVAPTYVAGSTADIAFKKINAFRAAQGLGPLNQNANADIAAKNHQAYVALNNSGANGHVEVAGTPGFTGATVKDRLVAAGYPATIAGEVIAFSLEYPNPDTSAVDNLINTVYHRASMMYQGFTAVGVAGEDATNPLYMDFGATKAQLNAGDYVGVYPANGQTAVWLTHSVESPNPFYQEMDMTQANMCTKTSAPVSLTSEASTTLSVTSFTVTEAGQTTPLDVRLITSATSTQDTTYLGTNVAFVVGKAPFKANTTYNVHFVGKATGAATGSANGLSIDKLWSFTTGSYKRGCP